MAPNPADRRKYPRIRAPKEMWVAWKSAGQNSTSHAETMGLGGLFLRTAEPPSVGSMIELIIELSSEVVRARAIVRRSIPGEGMGVEFVHMRQDDRAKVNRFLVRHDDSPKAATVAPPSPRPPQPHSTNSQLAIFRRTEKQAQAQFEREVMHLIEVTGAGTYYQLLGVASESPRSHVKKSYYSLVRKFHPDNHVGDRKLIPHLVDLMTVITEAYRTLANDESRAAYDKRLAVTGGFTMNREKSETEESLEDWLNRANECLHANNFAGSIVWLRKCLEAAPENALYHALLARSLGAIPQYHSEALEHFQKAIELDPWKEPVYVQYAELFEKMQLPRRAAYVYTKLLEINPTHARASERLAAFSAEGKEENISGWISNLFDVKS